MAKRTEQEINLLKQRYPSVPDHAISRTKKAKSSPTNQLTSDIKDYCKSIGAFAFRINSTGTYSEKLGKYIMSGSEKGVSDLLICFKGFLIASELKIGRDKQRPEQKAFQEKVEQAGGHYFICSSLDSFKLQFNQIINK